LYIQDAYETLDTTEVFFDTQLLQIIMEEVNSGLRRLQRHAACFKHCRGKDINSDMRRKKDYIGLLFVASMAEGMT
jgi:hypothetical protein